MNIERKYLPWFFVMFLAGSAVGFLIGAYSGGNFGMSLVLNNWLNQDALELNNKLDALRQLRGGETAAAIETLEASVDDTLVIFDPVEPYPGLKDVTLSAIDSAIDNAIDYRRDFPRRSSRPHVDKMIEGLFERHRLDLR